MHAEWWEWTLFWPRLRKAFVSSCKATSSSPSTTRRTPAEERRDGKDPCERLQDFSFGAWTSMLLRSVLESRTPFSEFLKTTLHSKPMHESAGEQALLPLIAFLRGWDVVV